VIVIKKFIPALDWIRNYNKSDLTGDLSAGLIVAIMLIPQGMAYAMLAGLPPVIGLYASTIPLFIYALFGSSRQLSVGPVAMLSLLVLTGVSTMAEPGTEKYISLTLLLMLMIGLIQFLMGILRLGFIVNFLSHAVISGFTSAAAIIIGLSQLKDLVGVKLEANHVLMQLIETFTRLPEIHPITVMIGVGSIILLIVFKNYIRQIPGPIVVVVLGIFLVSRLQLEKFGLAIVGQVPQGLPTFSLPTFSIDAVIALLPIALTISFVGFMESIAMAKALASREKYHIEPNRELIGLGLANIGGSFFSAYPVTGGFSRSAVNYESGARTPLATIITAFLILLTLLFFTDFFYYLPKAVLAAIIMVAVYSLIDIKEALHLFNIRRVDGWTWLITFIATLSVGIEQGILIGLAFSLVVFVARSAYPHITELGLLPEKNVYRNIKRFPTANVDPQIAIIRVDASLYFANMSYLEEELCKRVKGRPQTNWLILDFSGVNSIDAVAVGALETIMETCRQEGVQFLFTGIKGPVMDLLKKANWEDKYGHQFKYISIDHALDDIKKGA